MNFLFTSAGRRYELISRFKSRLPGAIVTSVDCQSLVPAFWASDHRYVVPEVQDKDYIEVLLDICQKESIDAVFPLIDPEISILAEHRKLFDDIGTFLFVPDERSAAICYDKLAFYRYMEEKKIATHRTFSSTHEFDLAYREGSIDFPVFVKPRFGSGSVGARKITSTEALEAAYLADPSLIIQEHCGGLDIGVDVYVDALSHEAVCAFSKRKLSMAIGGANKTISFLDEKLFTIVKEICQMFRFRGPVDIDLFYRDGVYYVTEINPRFGGAYIQADEAGVDFTPFIQRNLDGLVNEPHFGGYPENHMMLMYDTAVFDFVSTDI